MRAWEWLKRNALIIFACLAVAYMLIPIVVIAVFSFGDTPAGKLTFGLNDGFTLEYWKDAFAIDALNESLLTSLKLAARGDAGLQPLSVPPWRSPWSATSSAGARRRTS